MLSFELKSGSTNEQPDELEVYGDRDGLRALRAQLDFLIQGSTEHVHLMAESWGGTHLDESPHHAGNVPIKHVKFILR